MTTIHYSVHCCRFSCNGMSDPLRDSVGAAEDAADDYHSNHDGWDGAWPIVLMLLTEDGSEIGRFDIEREFDPVFSARKLEVDE